VQDLGRFGWRRFGVPSSGALDRAALVAANAALGNEAGVAAMELTFPGPTLRVLDAADIAVAGADLDARVNGSPLDPEEPVAVRSGDVLTFEAPRRGQWAYLAVCGGIDVPPVFGSRSTYARGGLGGVAGQMLRAGDVLGRGEGASGSRRIGRSGTAPNPPGPVRVIMGPQADGYAIQAEAALLSQPFEATVHRDRSGMRLRGPVLRHRGRAEIPSDALLPGAIQVPANGQPIVILADGPTTGGYTKIASVIDADLDRVGQITPGETVRFQAVTVAAAHEVYRAGSARWSA